MKPTITLHANVQQIYNKPAKQQIDQKSTTKKQQMHNERKQNQQQICHTTHRKQIYNKPETNRRQIYNKRATNLQQIGHITNLQQISNKYTTSEKQIYNNLQVHNEPATRQIDNNSTATFHVLH
jgi:hypothetical protein